MTVTAPAASPEHLNQLMIDAIAAARPVGTSDPRVLAAIRAVPRHAFVPGADLADAYNPDLAVITKRAPPGPRCRAPPSPISSPPCSSNSTSRPEHAAAQDGTLSVRVPGAHVPPFPVPLWRAGASGWAEPEPETMQRVAAAVKRL